MLTDHEPSVTRSAGVLACEFWRRPAAIPLTNIPLTFRFVEKTFPVYDFTAPR
jgi:hypothetical protein